MPTNACRRSLPGAWLAFSLLVSLLFAAAPAWAAGSPDHPAAQATLVSSAGDHAGTPAIYAGDLPAEPRPPAVPWSAPAVTLVSVSGIATLLLLRRRFIGSSKRPGDEPRPARAARAGGRGADWVPPVPLARYCYRCGAAMNRADVFCRQCGRRRRGA